MRVLFGGQNTSQVGQRTQHSSSKGKPPQRNPLQAFDLASGADRDRTGDPLLAKPTEKVPRFYKLLNLRAVLGIGVAVRDRFDSRTS